MIKPQRFNLQLAHDGKGNTFPLRQAITCQELFSYTIGGNVLFFTRYECLHYKDGLYPLRLLSHWNPSHVYSIQYTT